MFRKMKKSTTSRRRTTTRAVSSKDAAGGVRRKVLRGEERTKLDVSPDLEFYSTPRFVTHVDDDFLAQTTELYRRRIPANGSVLDLCSSWVSHLPREKEYKKVWGHGMNATELGRNERLDGFFVRDFNEDPRIQAPDCSFDAVTMCVSVQYLQRAEEVFAEIFRVLKPGGVVIITFSNRLFYSKAIQAWRDASGYARVQLVKSYFDSVAGFTKPEVVTDLEGIQDDSILGKIRRFFARSQSDPFYAVIAYRNFRPIYDDDCVRLVEDGECLADGSFDSA
jgi:SAM-dependent methyltransferase